MKKLAFLGGLVYAVGSIMRLQAIDGFSMTLLFGGLLAVVGCGYQGYLSSKEKPHRLLLPCFWGTALVGVVATCFYQLHWSGMSLLLILFFGALAGTCTVGLLDK